LSGVGTDTVAPGRTQTEVVRSRWGGEFVRYLVVGVATNGGGYLLFALLTALGIGSVAAISILYPIQIALAFLLNKRWTFGHQGKTRATVVKYLVALVVCYLLNVAALKLFAGYLGFSHLIVQACALVVLGGLLFVAQRYWVFRPESDDSAGEAPL
jgi:putative flippase GtrA